MLSSKMAFRTLAAAIPLVLFNTAMVVFVARAASPIGTPLFVAWFIGDFILSLVALAVTEADGDGRLKQHEPH
jgi:hypothetical protein